MDIKRIGIIVFVGVLVVAGYWAKIGIDTNHDGISLKPALDIVWGKVLYRDTFSHYGPLMAYTHAGAMKLFGEKLIIIKFTAAMAYALTGVMVWWLSYKLTNKNIALWAVILWLGLATYYYQHFYVWASVYGALMHLATICWLWRTVENNLKNRDVLILGILAGAAFWFKQPYLMTIIALVIVFWFRGWRKKLPVLFLGFVLTGMVVLATIYYSGGLIDWLKQNIWVGYINGRVLGDDNTLLETVNYFWRRPLWLVLALESGWVCWRMRGRKYWAVFALAVSSLVHYLPLLDDSHMYWAATPVFPIWIYSLVIMWKERINIFKKAMVLITVFLVLGELGMRIKSGVERINNNQIVVQIQIVLQRMKTNLQTAHDLGNFDIVTKLYLAENPEKKIVSLSMDALYMTFDKKAQNIESLYCDLSGLASGVYPYHSSIQKYIELQRPLVLADEGEKTPIGYEKISEWSYLNKVLLAPIISR